MSKKLPLYVSFKHIKSPICKRQLNKVFVRKRERERERECVCVCMLIREWSNHIILANGMKLMK